MNPAWQETTIDGPRTRRWSLDAKQCPELTAHHIAWLGIDTVYSPYRRVRLAPSGSFFLACLEGEGRVLLEGRWERVAAGALCLAPPRVLNAFHAVPGKRWEIGPNRSFIDSPMLLIHYSSKHVKNHEKP